MGIRWIMYCILTPIFLYAQTVVTVTDSDINANDNITWTSNNEYLLDGLVFVEGGATLTIEAGTVIRGKAAPTTGDNTSALIIARGAKIIADGNVNAPIIFTAENDDLSNPNDLLPTDRGLWGGVIILGNARINTTAGEGQIEGIDPNEVRARYGGNDDADSSGVLRYVSIRHGGAELAPGDEINALSLGGVGNGTIIEYVEAYANLDDGFEWFGGTVDGRYLVSAFNADDGMDWDQGFRGRGQFWFILQATDKGGRGAEQDGGTDPEDGQPFAIPVISNATYIGPGTGSFPEGDGGQQLIFRDNSGGKYYNSIFTEYNGGQGGAGITVEDLATGEDSRSRMEAGDLVLSNNIWWQFGNGNTLADIAPQDFVQSHLSANSNQIVDPQIVNIVREAGTGLDPRPAANGPAANGAVAMGDPFFTNVSYHGAFDPNAAPWIRHWTALWDESIVGIEETALDNGVIPQTFAVSQNYPNPFNPSTNIRYELSRQTQIRLTVYNLRGQKVATLVDGVKPAGAYVVTWNAKDLSSGLYFYRFEANGRTVQTRKMMLIK